MTDELCQRMEDSMGEKAFDKLCEDCPGEMLNTGTMKKWRKKKVRFKDFKAGISIPHFMSKYRKKRDNYYYWFGLYEKEFPPKLD